MAGLIDRPKAVVPFGSVGGGVTQQGDPGERAEVFDDVVVHYCGSTR